ncbi:hypothetical protein QFZ55_005761 [Streptomyces luteogriseus]|nr:hypothetical protein [Streptomyces luteogriseus]
MPSSTTSATTPETDTSSTAITRYPTTAPIPGPTTVSDWLTVCTSLTPIVTTSPAPACRRREAPSRTACPTTTFTVRKLASMRTRVMVRCRMMLSQALKAPTANSAPLQSVSALMSPGSRPSSIARDIRYGVAASSTIHTVPNIAPAAHRPGCRATSHHR